MDKKQSVNNLNNLPQHNLSKHAEACKPVRFHNLYTNTE